MSSRFALALLGAMIGGAPAEGQSVAQERARLREQVRTLEALATNAAEAFERYRMSLGTRLSDTVRAGTLSVITTARHRVIAEEAVANAWSIVRPALGRDTTLLADRPFIAVSRTDRGSSIRSVDAFLFRDSVDASDMTGRLLFAIERRFAQMLRAPNGNWFAHGWLDTLRTTDVRNLYVELVTASAPAGRDCFMGTLEACAEYLGVSGDYNRYDRWYSVEQRINLAVTQASVMRRRERDRWDPAFEACLDRNERTCMRFLETFQPGGGQGPASPLSRRALQQLAVDVGGVGAYGRALTAADTSVKSRLEAASGMPWERLLDQWRTMIVQQAVDRPPVRRTTGWIALLWVAVLAVVAGRSSRWSRV